MPIPHTPPAWEAAILSALRQQGAPLRSVQLQQALGISQPTASRALAALVQSGAVVKLGQGRSQHYGVPRPVAGVGPQIPVAAIDAAGQVQPCGSLYALHGGGYWVEGAGLRALLQGGAYFDGLPWAIQDMHPQGFLGRRFARQHLGQTLGADPRQWSEDDLLLAITRFGDDLPGHLIVGEAALRRYLQQPSPPVAEPQDYPALAQAAIEGAVPGSSAGGEQPKFCCLDGAGRSWIVKFSPADDNPVAERIRTLLRCEHLALQTLHAAGQPVAHTRLHTQAGRVFLAAQRFDRTAPQRPGQPPGRIGMVSLQAFNAEFVGTTDQWAKTAQRLQDLGLLSSEDAQRLRLWDAFGQLIANTDRHYGNVSLLWNGKRWVLAPCYDMLPMRFMPVHGEVPAWQWDMAAVQPCAAVLPVWDKAQALARQFWAQVEGMVQRN
ncbi:MAG: type II toxin-antitoxin system HipA family toxin YjjJ [Comamonas sp.]|nr:type II toxin-antitoxin system HipA family toxin YjjJ [Comamonas sp.]